MPAGSTADTITGPTVSTMSRRMTSVMAIVLCCAAAARGQSLSDRLLSPDVQTREAARHEFFQADEPMQRSTVRELLLVQRPSDSVDRAFDALGGPGVDKYLIETVTDEESFFVARRALFTTLQPDAQVLQPKLADRNQYVRWAAAMTLAWNGLVPQLPEQIVPVIVEAFKEGSPAIRKEAAEKLGSLSSYEHYGDVCAPVVDPVLIAAMHDQEFAISEGATRALGACPSVPVSIAAREIADPHGASLTMIGNLDKRGVANQASAELIAAIQDERFQVRDAAAKALRNAGVAPELYVPQILDDVKAAPDEFARAKAVDKLIAVAPAAAPWAPQMITMFREEPSPGVKRQLRIALIAVGTPEAKSVAAADQRNESLRAAAPYVGYVVLVTLVAVLLARTGWAVLLPYLLPVTSVIWFIDDNDAHALAGVGFAPIVSLAGLIAGAYVVARRDLGGKKWLGIVGVMFALVALLFSFVLAYGLYRGYAALGAG